MADFIRRFYDGLKQYKQGIADRLRQIDLGYSIERLLQPEPVLCIDGGGYYGYGAHSNCLNDVIMLARLDPHQRAIRERVTTIEKQRPEEPLPKRYYSFNEPLGWKAYLILAIIAIGTAIPVGMVGYDTVKCIQQAEIRRNEPVMKMLEPTTRQSLQIQKDNHQK